MIAPPVPAPSPAPGPRRIDPAPSPQALASGLRALAAALRAGPPPEPVPPDALAGLLDLAARRIDAQRHDLANSRRANVQLVRELDRKAGRGDATWTH